MQEDAFQFEEFLPYYKINTEQQASATTFLVSLSSSFVWHLVTFNQKTGDKSNLIL